MKEISNKSITKTLLWITFFSLIPYGVFSQVNDASDNSFALLKAVTAQEYNRAEYLLNTGANPNSKDFQGVNALMFSTQLESDSIFFLLLEYGANMTIKDNEGNSLLMHAVWSKSDDLFKIVLENESHINHLNKEGYTALTYLAQTENTDRAQKLLDAGANPKLYTNNRLSPLMYAVAFGQFFMSDFLLFYDSDVNAQSKTGASALHLAAWYGHKEIMGLLMEYGANIDIQDETGNTPLWVSVFAKNPYISYYLLESGADPTISNKKEEDAFLIAAKNRDVETLKLLSYYMQSSELTHTSNIRKAFQQSLHTKNKEMETLLKEVWGLEPRGLFASGLDIQNGLQFNARDLVYKFSLGLYENRFGVYASLDYKQRTSPVKILHPDTESSFIYQFHENRKTFSLGLQKDMMLFSNGHHRWGTLVGADVNYSLASYNGTNRDAPEGFGVSPALDIYYRYSAFKFLMGYRFERTAQPSVNYGRYNMSVGFVIPLFRASSSRYHTDI